MCSFNKDLDPARDLIQGGTWVPLDTLPANIDLNHLRKVHKLKDPELDPANMVGALVSRIAAKDML